ncbi:MAG: YabP/YqfC family sporulation protein [Clostridia bacterium]|nr:YabP/YqfC family sporulation protein [Clostridia bacterium]
MAENHSERKSTWRQKLSERHYTSEPILCTDTVVLHGQGGATVYSCRRILLYAPERICLLTQKRQICLNGKNLICTSFTAGTVRVDGRIESIRFCTDVCGGVCCYAKSRGREAEV